MFVKDLLPYKNQGTGVFIRWNNSFLFVIGNTKYWTESDSHWMITYTNTGGHVEKNENILDATKREVFEELGCDINLISSTRTLTCNLENPTFRSYELRDKICPFLIYNSLTIQMSVGVYFGTLHSDPVPMMEVPAIIFLLPSLIKGGELSMLLRKGAVLITQKGSKIPKRTILKPYGSVEILVNNWDKFLSLESFNNFLEESPARYG